MSMENKLVKQLKSQAKELEPVVRIGKNGITEATVNEVKKVLKKRKLVKVKLLKSSFEGISKKDLAAELADKTGAAIIEQVGFVVVLYKR